MSHALKYATVVPAKSPLGESTFAAARHAIEAKYGVTPDEVFLDTVQVDGPVTAGDIVFDLGELGLRFLVFGADYPAIPDVPLPVEDVPVDSTTTTTS